MLCMIDGHPCLCTHCFPSHPYSSLYSKLENEYIQSSKTNTCTPVHMNSEAQHKKIRKIIGKIEETKLRNISYNILTGQQVQQLKTFCCVLAAFRCLSAPTKSSHCKFLDRQQTGSLSSSERSGK